MDWSTSKAYSALVNFGDIKMLTLAILKCLTQDLILHLYTSEHWFSISLVFYNKTSLRLGVFNLNFTFMKRQMRIGHCLSLNVLICKVFKSMTTVPMLDLRT